MEKIARHLTQKLNRFQKRIESLLETETSHVDPEAPPFEASRDTSLVRDLSVGLPDDHIDRGIVIFGRLAGLYQAGVLFENHDGQWRAQATFRDGLTKLLSTEKAKSLTLPKVAPLTALKADSENLLKKLGLLDLDPGNHCKALLMKPVPDFAYLLLSPWPDLWLKDHVEQTLKSLSDGFAG